MRDDYYERDPNMTTTADELSSLADEIFASEDENLVSDEEAAEKERE